MRNRLIFVDNEVKIRNGESFDKSRVSHCHFLSLFEGKTMIMITKRASRFCFNDLRHLD